MNCAFPLQKNPLFALSSFQYLIQDISTAIPQGDRLPMGRAAHQLSDNLGPLGILLKTDPISQDVSMNAPVGNNDSGLVSHKNV
jgi:hypothetical protein